MPLWIVVLHASLLTALCCQLSGSIANDAMGEEAPIPDSIRMEIERVYNAMVGHAGIKRTVKRLVDAG